MPTEEQLVNYFSGWPKPDCPYMQDLIYAMRAGSAILKNAANKSTQKKKCVIFDVDDCLVFGDPASVVGVKEMEWGNHLINGEKHGIFTLPKNEPIYRLAVEAKQLGFMIIIITARPKESREATRWNFREYNIPYDVIICDDKDDGQSFKVGVRRKIAQSYEICLTIGDQITDVLCPGKAAAIKLPDPESLVTYVWTGV